MVILLSADDQYAQHVCVTIRSLLDNASAPESLSIKLISDNISQNNQQVLQRSLDDFDSTLDLEVIDIQEQQVLQFDPITDYLSAAAYHRIYVAQILSKYDGKVVYLDSDLIVRKDIIRLFETDIGENCIGAVRNKGLNHQELLGMPTEKEFFNSGVMLIDLQNWRKNEVQQKVLNYIYNNNDSLKYADQCALNAILYDDWYELNPTWNVHRYYFRHKKDFENVIKDPAIVHFTTREKPWFFMTNHPFKKEYYKFLNMTGWSDYTPPDFTLSNFFKKYYYIIEEQSKKI